MPVPQTPESEITIQSVIFDQDAVTITYAETADVHVLVRDDGQAAAIVQTHVVTIDRRAGVKAQLSELEEVAQDALVACVRQFEQLPSLADAASTASQGDDDDDEFRGLGD